MARQKILVLTNGERFPVTGDFGKYWLTDGQKFRKLSQMIQRVEEVDTEPEKEEACPVVEATEEEKPAKPEAKKKKSSKPSAAKQKKDMEE